MTTLTRNVPPVQFDDSVHVVVATGPVADFATYLGPKSCRTAVVVGVDPADSAVIAAALLPGVPCAAPSGSSVRFDGVSLPKIESGPSGRDVGTWHLPAEC